MSPSSSSPPPPPPGKGKETPIIIKKKGGGGHEGHHGGSWKVAYADFVTAMMALFLLLWLVASLRPDQKSALADVFQDKKPPTQGQAEQIPFMPKNARPGVPELKLNTDEQVKVNVALMIKELISKNPTLVKNTGISTDEYGVILNVNNNIMFETNSAVMRPEAKQVIDDVVEVLKNTRSIWTSGGTPTKGKPADPCIRPNGSSRPPGRPQRSKLSWMKAKATSCPSACRRRDTPTVVLSCRKPRKGAELMRIAGWSSTTTALN